MPPPRIAPTLDANTLRALQRRAVRRATQPNDPNNPHPNDPHPNAPRPNDPLQITIEETLARLDLIARPLDPALALDPHAMAIAQTLKQQNRITRIATPPANEPCRLALSVMTLHLLRDLPGALGRIRASLAPDSPFVGVAVGANSLTAPRQALAQAEFALTGAVSPRFMPLTPPEALAHALTAAGFVAPVLDADIIPTGSLTFSALANRLRDLGQTNALADRPTHAPPRTLFHKAQALWNQDNGAQTEIVAIHFVAWTPPNPAPKPAPAP